MQSTLKLIGLSIVTAVFLAPAVYAQNADRPVQTTTVDQAPTAQTQGEDGVSERTTRHAERKERLQLNLSATQTERIKSRCKNAQGKIQSLSGRVQGIQTGRQQKYSNLVSRISTLTVRLEASAVDTAQLSEQTATLSSLIEAYEAQLANYQVALGDLSAIDCVADPEAFQATLVDARTSLSAVREAMEAIKAHLSEAIKPALQSTRQSVSQQSKPDEQPSDEQPAGTAPDTPVSNTEEQ